jgi:hypothetical protein
VSNGDWLAQAKLLARVRQETDREGLVPNLHVMQRIMAGYSRTRREVVPGPPSVLSEAGRAMAERLGYVTDRERAA